MKKTLIIVTFFITAVTASLAQKEAYNWYFGNSAALTWKNTQNVGGLTDLPTSITLPTLPSAMTNQEEGVFSMSDADGNLMFYSDGMTVWNKSHSPMSNADAANSTGLTGGISSSQSGIVIPFLGNPNQYMVFTISQIEGGGAKTANYSIIDMSLNSGNGNVTATKNIPLINHSGDLMEQIAAVRISNGSGYWIVAVGHGNPGYLNVWKVTSTAGSPNVTFHRRFSLPTAVSNTAAGYLCFSTKGNYFALGTLSDHNMFVGKFNPAATSGEFSNIKRITYSIDTNIYGVEFSSSGKVLYATDCSMDGLVYAYKFEDLLVLSNASPANTSLGASQKQIGAYPSTITPVPDISFPGALQLGPDGRIYGTLDNSRNMLVINDVENYNAAICTKLDDFLAAGMAGRYGLPNFLGSYFENLTSPQLDSVCIGNTVNITFKLSSYTTGTTPHWYTTAADAANGLVSSFTGGTYSHLKTAKPVDTLYVRVRNTAGTGWVNDALVDTVLIHIPANCAAPAYRYWYISSPYSNSNPRVFITPYDTLGGNAGSMLGYYNEPQKRYTEPFYEYNFNAGTYFQPGRGIIASLDTTITRFNPPTAATFTGGGYGTTANTGTITVPVDSTNTVSSQASKAGKNLLGNPYSDYIDFDLFYNYNNTVINPTLWIRGLNKSAKPMKMTYDTYNSASGVGTGNINGTNLNKNIPPIQAFWVQAKMSGNVYFEDSHKTGNDPSQSLRAPQANANRIARIKVSAGKISDETVLVFNPQASNAYDTFDSEKMSNGEKDIPELYTKTGNKDMAINGMQPVTNEQYLSLGFRTGRQNTFTISGSFENCDNMQVILRDNQTGAETDLTAGNVYSFASGIYNNTSRFTLKINENVTEVNTPANNNNVVVYVNNDNQIIVAVETDNYPSLQPATAQVYNTIGQKLHEQTLNFQFSILNCQLNAGVYLVKVGGKTERVVIK
ncbi:MAG: T9SS type A sorting domain-containing protein [Paludibacter sp.]|jgi:hypothetical protein|nr:T9SS type A sorting domain-containing protein [Paludibacter sp.]